MDLGQLRQSCRFVRRTSRGKSYHLQRRYARTLPVLLERDNRPRKHLQRPDVEYRYPAHLGGTDRCTTPPVTDRRTEHGSHIERNEQSPHTPITVYVLSQELIASHHRTDITNWYSPINMYPTKHKCQAMTDNRVNWVKKK